MAKKGNKSTIKYYKANAEAIILSSRIISTKLTRMHISTIEARRIKRKLNSYGVEYQQESKDIAKTISYLDRLLTARE